MAKKRDNNPGNQNTAWDEAGLSKLTREKLLEIAREFGIGFSDNPADEEIIKAILEAQKEDSEPSQEDPDKPPENPPPPSPAEKSGKEEAGKGNVRIKNESCKNGKVFLGNGKLAEFDADGIAEIEADQAERLLKIPGYEKV
jgi:hypothetical protein